MDEVLGAIAIFIAAVIGVVIGLAATLAAIGIVAALTMVVYAVAMPVTYVLTVALLLKGTALEEGSRAAEEVATSADSAAESGILHGQPSVPGWDSRADVSAQQSEDAPSVLSEFLMAPHSGRERGRVWSAVHVDEGVAEPSYFFGPAADDVEDVMIGGIQRCAALVGLGTALIREISAGDLTYLGFIGSAGLIVGMITGGVIGAAMAILVAVVHVVITGLTVLLALLTWTVLRCLDWFRRLVERVRMPCPVCHTAVKPYPTYQCPGCLERHQDIRPGPRGVITRRCKCGAQLPTSLLFGAGSLMAECPSCNISLPDKFGKIPEIVIPFFGGLNVGKTQLMYSLTYALQSIVEAHRGTVKLEGDAVDRLNGIEGSMATKGEPGKTLPETPRAYILRLKLGLDERLIYLFDAAGELHYKSDGLDRLNYLDKARMLIFVVDPLADDKVWSAIPSSFQHKLSGVRSIKAENEIAYQKTREHMRRMGARKKYARLAMVISKADILDEAGVTSPLSDSKEPVREWLESSAGLNMGNLVREARQGFADVGFFHTAAVVDGLGLPDRSVMELARWLLWSEGVRLGQTVVG